MSQAKFDQAQIDYDQLEPNATNRNKLTEGEN